MSEAARRKKLAGISARLNDPLDAARRFWRGKQPVAPDEFRVPEGLLAITFDVEGAPPSTCCIDPAQLVDLLDALAEVVGSNSYHDVVRTTARAFIQARLGGDDALLRSIGPLGFWTAFDHPQSGEAMREAVSARLRQDGKAHLTWRFGPDGLAIALAPRFIDLPRCRRSRSATVR